MLAQVTTPHYGTARLVNQNELELERFVDGDTILPFYRIPLTAEHLAAWVVKTLDGCTCKRLVVADGCTPGVKRATRKDAALVYYYVTDTSSVTFIRGGKAHVVSFAWFGDHLEKAEDFLLFITGLVCDTPEPV